MKKYSVDSLSKYINIVTKIAKKEENIWFRGHSKAQYRLIPTVLRDVRSLRDSRGEKIQIGQIVVSEGGTVTGMSAENMYYEFKSRASPFLTRQPENKFEWMFLMQHYGVPTRLLDWTTNALVALFFAVEREKVRSESILYDCTPSEQFLKHDEFCSEGAAVYAINPYKLNEKTILDSSRIYLCDEPEKWDHYFDPMNKNGDNFFPIAVQSSHIDTRIRAQSGHFTLHGANIWAIDYFNDLRDILYKIFIPYTETKKIYNELALLGINRTFIYPGLESLANDVKNEEYFRYQRKSNS